MKKMIWSNDYSEIEAIAKDIRDDCPGTDWDVAISEAREINDEYLWDEKSNLNIDVGGDIIVFGDLGFWNGRVLGYKALGSHNLKDCVSAATCGDYIDWYVEDGDVKIKEVHHDGTNFLTFRAWRDEVRPIERDVLLYMIRNATGEARDGLWDDINKMTRPLGEYVNKVYGWG